jgi:hypothetical protein
MTLRETVQVEKLKVSLKEALLEYHTYYLSEFQNRWRHVPESAVTQAVEELEKENFLTVRIGRKSAKMLALREA